MYQTHSNTLIKHVHEHTRTPTHNIHMCNTNTSHVKFIARNIWAFCMRTIGNTNHTQVHNYRTHIWDGSLLLSGLSISICDFLICSHFGNNYLICLYSSCMVNMSWPLQQARVALRVEGLCTFHILLILEASGGTSLLCWYQLRCSSIHIAKWGVWRHSKGIYNTLLKHNTKTQY